MSDQNTTTSSENKALAVAKSIVRSTAMAVMLLVAYGATSHSNQAHAACAYTPDPSQGQVTQTISFTSTVPNEVVRYRVWSRIMAPNLTANSYFLQISGVNGGCAFKVGDSAITPNTWTWVDYQNNDSTSKIDVDLTAGVNYTVTYTGDAAGVDVELDRVLFLSDATCVPTGKGDNCASSDTTSPTVSISTPAPNAKVGGTVTLTATADDGGGSGVTRVDFYDGFTPTPIGSVTTTPGSNTYSVNWDTTAPGMVNGSTHVLAAFAYDAAGNPPGSTSVTVTISNPPTLTSVSPATGTTAGSTGITLTGTNFLPGATVNFGTTPGTGVVVNSPTSITVNAPAHAAGVVDVTVTNTDGKTVTKTGAYTYTAIPKPDLIVTAVLNTPLSPVVGAAVRFSATIKNNGTADTAAGTAINVQFKEGATVLATTAVPAGSLAAGTSTTIAAAADWVATSGSHTVVATVDYANLVPESNESNNTKSIILNVGVPAPPCDINNDGHCDDTEFLALLLQYGRTGSGLSADWDHNQAVDDSDFLILLLNYWAG